MSDITRYFRRSHDLLWLVNLYCTHSFARGQQILKLTILLTARVRGLKAMQLGQFRLLQIMRSDRMSGDPPIILAAKRSSFARLPHSA